MALNNYSLACPFTRDNPRKFKNYFQLPIKLFILVSGLFQSITIGTVHRYYDNHTANTTNYIHHILKISDIA